MGTSLAPFWLLSHDDDTGLHAVVSPAVPIKLCACDVEGGSHEGHDAIDVQRVSGLSGGRETARRMRSSRAVSRETL